MRKFLFLLALLILLGVATQSFAISIPEAEDPAGGPAIWLVPVFNNAGATMDVGDVAVWQFQNSTGDNDNYITTTTTADTYIVAGVVYGANIADQGYGLLAVHGIVQVDLVTATAQTEGGLICSGTTAGAAKTCSVDAANFGIVTTAGSSNSANVFVNGRN